MIEIEITGVKDVIKKLKKATSQSVIRRTLLRSATFLQGWVKKNRLSGPRPTYLGVVTNRLRSSISRSSVEKTLSGLQIRIGTNVEYAARHEFGFKGVERVKSHNRSSPRGTVFVRGFSRTMNLRARPFLRPAIQSRTNQIFIEREFKNNVERALKE